VNDSWGLHVFARDRLDADNITADSNGSLVANYGADLNAAYIYGAGASYFRYNTTYGLTANATQSISLTQVVADYNTSYGAWLGADNGSVSVDGGTNSSFSHNGVDNGKGADPDAYGLNVTAYANITLSNVLTADHNATYGASLNGAVGDGSGFIKVSGSGFKYNGTSGLYAGTDGDVTLS
ncbi:hypothetical protein JZU69_06385, partial [bacterium]|nr:hypothetical protein [bacterium]